MAEDLHDEIDALARDIERSIKRTEQTLEQYEPITPPDQHMVGENVDAEELFS